MATSTIFLGVPDSDCGIAWDHIVEWHYFPPMTPKQISEAEAEGETPRHLSLLVLTLAVLVDERVIVHGDTAVGQAPLTLRFTGTKAGRMADALRANTFGC